MPIYTHINTHIHTSASRIHPTKRFTLQNNFDKICRSTLLRMSTPLGTNYTYALKADADGNRTRETNAKPETNLFFTFTGAA